MSKLTIKQEKFCQKQVELGIGSDAYRQSYNADSMSPEAIHVEVTRLLKNPKITLRIKELQAAGRKRHDVTVDSLTAEYDDIKTRALDDKVYAPAVSCVTGKAKLHGLITDKNEVTGKDGEPIKVQEVTAFEIAKTMSFLLTKAMQEKK